MRFHKGRTDPSKMITILEESSSDRGSITSGVPSIDDSEYIQIDEKSIFAVEPPDVSPEVD